MWLQSVTGINYAGVIDIKQKHTLPVNSTFIQLPTYLFAKMNYISLNDTFEPNKQGSSSNVNQINKTCDRSGLAEQLLVSLSEESICSMELFCNVLFFFLKVYNSCTHSCSRSLDSSVSVVNRLWAKRSSIEIGLPSEPSESSFLLKQNWGPVSTGDSHQGVKRSRVETYH
jgi:hypothetical protein